jgi:hypothetical protein
LVEQLDEALVAGDERAFGLVGDQIRLAVEAGFEAEGGGGE